MEDKRFLGSKTAFYETIYGDPGSVQMTFAHAADNVRFELRVTTDDPLATGWSRFAGSVNLHVGGTAPPPLDLDVDSDNDDGLNDPDRSSYEDEIEDDDDEPGKIVFVDDAEFVPLIVELPASVDPAAASVGFDLIATGGGKLDGWKRDDGPDLSESDRLAWGQSYAFTSLEPVSGNAQARRIYVEATGISVAVGDQRIAARLTAGGTLASDLVILTADAALGTVDLRLEGLLNDAAEMNPGGYVLVNANNHNGSEVTDRIPAPRDFEIGPDADPVDRRGEKDMKALTMNVPKPQPNETRQVRLTWTGNNVKVWPREDKSQAAITSPKVWTLGQQKPVYVEGIEPSEALRNVHFTLEVLDQNGQVIPNGSDELKLSVTPVLTALRVDIGANTDPDFIATGPEGSGLYSDAGGGGVETGNFAAAATVQPGQGSLRFVQNIHITNNLAGGFGADLGNDVKRKWDFAAPNAGATLVDYTDAGKKPFYTQGYDEDRNGLVVTATATDSPALKTFGVEPQHQNDVTHIDVTYHFDLYVVWEFKDDTIYALGKTQWSVRFSGTLIRNQQGNLIFDGNADNANTAAAPGDFEFVHTNPVVSDPAANDAHPAWRF